MSHFDIVRWTDFVRGVADPVAAAAMDQHLAGGCPSCGALVTRLKAVTAVAELDRTSTPPDHLTRFARAAFSLQRPERTLALPELVARLLFSSAPGALAVGRRGPVDEMNRQTLYEAGDFTVHLKFEQTVGTPQISLVGQVANRRLPEPPLAHLPVMVTSGKRIVARCMSNEFGEFQVEYEPREGLELQIPLPDSGRRIRLSLSDSGGDE
jgi:hypothetical protein